VDGSQNDTVMPQANSDTVIPQANSVPPKKETVSESSARTLASEESISQFMDQVADLVKYIICSSPFSLVLTL